MITYYQFATHEQDKDKKILDVQTESTLIKKEIVGLVEALGNIEWRQWLRLRGELFKALLAAY